MSDARTCSEESRLEVSNSQVKRGDDSVWCVFLKGTGLNCLEPMGKVVLEETLRVGYRDVLTRLVSLRWINLSRFDLRRLGKSSERKR